MRRVLIVIFMCIFCLLAAPGQSIAETSQENAEAMKNAIASWEQQWSQSDPDYGIKKDRVLDRLELLLARAQKTNTLPKTVEQAVDLAEKARKDVESEFMAVPNNENNRGIYIDGAMDCGEWVQSRERQRSIAYETYLAGLINGLALGRKVEFWNAKGTVMSREQANLWMDNYCKSNPLSHPTAGAFLLFEERLR